MTELQDLGEADSFVLVSTSTAISYYLRYGQG